MSKKPIKCYTPKNTSDQGPFTINNTTFSGYVSTYEKDSTNTFPISQWEITNKDNTITTYTNATYNEDEYNDIYDTYRTGSGGTDNDDYCGPTKSNQFQCLNPADTPTKKPGFNMECTRFTDSDIPIVTGKYYATPGSSYKYIKVNSLPNQNPQQDGYCGSEDGNTILCTPENNCKQIKLISPNFSETYSYLKGFVDPSIKCYEF